VPFLRLTRDARGYEITSLLHASHSGEEPRVLYWYRTSPGLRVGRAPLDEDAIRTIEERHPEIDFDWPHILEVGATLVPEVERRPERPRRRPTRAAEEPAPAAPAEAVEAAESAPIAEPVVATIAESSADTIRAPEIDSIEEPAVEPVPAPSDVPPSRLLDELVGREIAKRLRDRYAEVIVVLRAGSDPSARAAWQPRANALNPDLWATPEEVLRGVEHADRLLDELRRDFA
jgi:hypothetical protein